MKTQSFTAVIFFGMLLLEVGVCSAAQPLRNWPIIARGDRDYTDQNANVRALQLLLTAHGNKVSADGVFGRSTQKALRQFQQANQLVASGVTNDPTWEALLLPLHQGSKGPAVQAAQFELRHEGYAVVTDGAFDSSMKVVVQRYQRQTGHTADGIIGRNTWYELLGGEIPSEGD